MENYEELHRLNFSTVQQKKELVANCSLCGNEVARFIWRTSKDRIIKKLQLMSKTRRCPFCEARYK